MGYITDHPERWTAKRTATSAEKEQLHVALARSSEWHTRTNKRARKYCAKLGYCYERLQTSEEWLAAFEESLLRVEYWSERSTIQQLIQLNWRRADLVLRVLYFFAQHARLQFAPAMEQSAAPSPGSPHEELRGNHHNLDNLLLRLACYLCGYAGEQHPPKSSMVTTLIQNLAGRYLGPRASDINPNRLARWARVADEAACVAPRSVERLRKNWIRTKARAWKILQKRAWHHFRLAWAAKTPATTWMFLLLCGCDAYGIHFMLGCLHRLLHF